MGISVTCAQCAASYTVRDDMAGKKVRCKQCTSVISVPAANAMLVDDPLETTAEEYAASQGSRTPRAAKEGSRTPAAAKEGSRTPRAAQKGSLREAQQRRASMQRTGGEAYRLEGETDAAPPQPPVWEKFERRKAPREPYTALLIMLHFAIAVGAAVRVLTTPAVRGADLMSFIVTRFAGVFIGCFLLAAPLVLLAVFGTSKLFNRRLPAGAYIKAAGAASVLFILFNLGLLLMPLPGSTMQFLTPQLITAGKLLGIGLFVAALVYAFGLGPFSGATASILCLIGFGILLSSTQERLADLQEIAAHPAVLAKAEESKPRAPAPRPNTVAVDARDIEANKVRNGLTALGNRIDFDPREELEGELKELEKKAEALASHAPAADLPGLIAEARRLLDRSVAETPDAKVFEPIAGVDRWTLDAGVAPSLGEEVSFRNYKLRPPKGALVDLSSSEDSPKGLIWLAGETGASRTVFTNDSARVKLSISTMPCANERQMRPWVISRPFQTRRGEAEKLLTINAAGADVSYGLVNDIGFTRISAAAQTGQRSIRYIGVEGGQWLVIEIAAPAGSSDAALFDGAIRSLRRAREGEPKSDPFSLPVLVERLLDSPQQAAALMKRHGEAAEDAVTPLLNSREVREQEAALIALTEVGTTKSLANLKRFLASKEARLREPARVAGQKIAPKELDDIAFALMDLSAVENPQLQKTALATLSKSKADQRRIRIAPILESMLMGKVEGANYEEAADALIVWATPQTPERISAALENQNCSPLVRRPVMRVLGELKDEKTARYVTPWLHLEPEAAEATLVKMGAAAEDAVIAVLQTAPVEDLRIAAARILEQIGTRKSLAHLQRASVDQRNPLAAEVAKRTLEVVRERSGRSTSGSRSLE